MRTPSVPAIRRPPVPLVRTGRGPEDGHPQDRLHGLLVLLATVAHVVAPRLVQSATAPKHRALVGSDDIATSAASGLTSSATFLLLVTVCLLVLLVRLGRLPADGHARLLVALAPWCYLVLRDLAAGSAPQKVALLYPLLVVTVWSLQPRLDGLRGLAHVIGGLAALSLAMGVLTPEIGLYRASSGELVAPDKVIVPWGVLVGPFTNGNNLGQVLSLGLPTVLLLRRRPVAWAVGLLVVAALVWSASRSSLAAAAAALGCAAALRLVPTGLRVAAGAAAVLGSVGAVVLLPLVTSSPTAFSNRGLIWNLSLASVETSPLTGHGSSYFSTVGQYVNPLPRTAYHGHNEFVHVLVTGGVAYLLLLGVLVAVTADRALRHLRTDGTGSLYPVTQLVAVAVSCTLEVSFGTVDRSFLLAVTVLPLAWILFARSPRDTAVVSVAGTR
ncbi:O-antigen ligase family protein [Kineococcus sp. NPDC059986]|uniref:O-antigen ligase family protein n=1 Tax=Kineococcus sp. NPDC059986 TaxID=3155538 RepID=UPI00344B0617